MPDTSFLAWPFFDDAHRTLARDLDAWAAAEVASFDHESGALDETCRALVATLGAGGWLRVAAPAEYGGARAQLDVRSICLARETLARHSGLADFQLTQARIAEMATAVDASALLVYRAAWTRDSGAPRVTREAAMAKLFATEAAQRVVDDAVQLFGGRGVVVGETVERLYREVRSLRIYEGTSEIQKLVIAGQVLGQGESSVAP